MKIDVNIINKNHDVQTMKRCKTCGAFCVERMNSKTNEKFWGCLNYKNHDKNENSKVINSSKTYNKLSPLLIETQHTTKIPSVARIEERDDTGNPISIIKKEFEPSKYQLAIFDFIKNGKGHGVVEAVAGSGKTTTLVKGFNYLPLNKSVVFVAFNKHIAVELSQKVSSKVRVMTLHSMGLSAIRNAYGSVRVEGDKQRNIIFEMLQNHPYIKDKEEFSELLRILYRLCSFIKATLSDINNESIEYLMDRYSMESSFEIPTLTEFVRIAIEISLKQKYVVDYDDMIYFPLKFNLPLMQYDFVFADECQDMNPSQLELVLMSVKKDGRIICVGDSRQSCYGFRCADTEAIPNMIKRLNATILPLSISYRCPKKHIELAKTIVPEIEYRKDAPDGVIKNIDYNEFFDIVKPGDMIICRNNAPLVKPAFVLLGRGIKTCIKGRDIGEGLVNIIKKLKVRSKDDFFKKLNGWKRDEINRCIKKGISTESVEDKYDVLMILSEDCDIVDCIVNKIKTIFSDENVSVVFSSIHRCKGEESRVVFILEPQLMPSRHAKQEWELIQENNIRYIAYTRSRDGELYFVSDDGSTE